MYDVGKFFRCDVVPADKMGKFVFGKLFSHFNVLVDTAHKCGLAFIQFPSIIDDCDGEHHDVEITSVLRINHNYLYSGLVIQ